MDEFAIERFELQNQVNEKVLEALQSIMSDIVELKRDIYNLTERIEELESKGE